MIIAVVILVVIYCVWAGLSTILAFAAGCIGGYLARGLKEEFKKDGK